jgi:hypothetical protein
MRVGIPIIINIFRHARCTTQLLASAQPFTHFANAVLWPVGHAPLSADRRGRFLYSYGMSRLANRAHPIGVVPFSSAMSSSPPQNAAHP